MAGFRYTATFTFERGEPVAASFDALSTLSTVERAMTGEWGPVRAILIEVNCRDDGEGC